MAELGRPTIMTEETLQQLREAFLMGCTDREACLYADIGTSTLYNYQEEHPDFVEQKKVWKENPILIARKSVVNALAGDYEHALKYLERRKKDEFAVRNELTGKEGDEIKINAAITGMRIIKDGDRVQNQEPEAAVSDPILD